MFRTELSLRAKTEVSHVEERKNDQIDLVFGFILQGKSFMKDPELNIEQHLMKNIFCLVCWDCLQGLKLVWGWCVCKNYCI